MEQSKSELKTIMESAKSERDGVFQHNSSTVVPTLPIKTKYSKNITVEEWNQLAINVGALTQDLSYEFTFTDKMYDLTKKLSDDVTRIDEDFYRNGELQVIVDAKIDGASIVSDGVAEVRLGPALSYTPETNAVGVSLGALPEVVPRRMSLEEQQNVMLLADNNGVLSRTSVADLGYVRLKVSSEDDLSGIGVNDFLFVKD